MSSFLIKNTKEEKKLAKSKVLFDFFVLLAHFDTIEKEFVSPEKQKDFRQYYESLLKKYTIKPEGTIYEQEKNKLEFQMLLKELYKKIPSYLLELEKKQKNITVEIQELVFNQSFSRDKKINKRIYKRRLNVLKNEYDQVCYEYKECLTFKNEYEKGYWNSKEILMESFLIN